MTRTRSSPTPQTPKPPPTGVVIYVPVQSFVARPTGETRDISYQQNITPVYAGDPILDQVPQNFRLLDPKMVP